MTSNSEVDYVDAITRYGHSCDEMSTVRLNPRKAIPLDQYPDETQIGVGVITHGKNMKKYVRYVLRVATENERLAAQARVWWSWWEKAQVEPSKAGPAPLVSPPIEEALRIAAARRSAESPIVTRAAAEGAGGPLGENRAATHAGGGTSAPTRSERNEAKTGNGGKRRKPARGSEPPPKRVTFADAVAGRPDLNLPRTPKTTLVRWIKAPQSATDLDVNPKGKVNAQTPLVDGLLRLQAQKKTRRRPPQMRAK